MRLNEFISPEEWQQLEQLIYASTYKALTAYQQQQASTRQAQQLAVNPIAKLKPQVAKKAKALARNAKQPPHVAPPRPLPKPLHVQQAKATATPAYRPVRTTTPLPPTTRMTVAKARPQVTQSAPNKKAPQSITNPTAIDQAARRMLPRDKQGPNPTDLFTP